MRWVARMPNRKPGRILRQAPQQCPRWTDAGGLRIGPIADQIPMQRRRQTCKLRLDARHCRQGPISPQLEAPAVALRLERQRVRHGRTHSDMLAGNGA